MNANNLILEQILAIQLYRTARIQKILNWEIPILFSLINFVPASEQIPVNYHPVIKAFSAFMFLIKLVELPFTNNRARNYRN